MIRALENDGLEYLHSKTLVHQSDCAVHNEPAEPNGPCDCGAEPPGGQGEVLDKTGAER